MHVETTSSKADEENVVHEPGPEQVEDNGAEAEKSLSTADAVFDQLLHRIQRGQWRVGFTLPSERELIEELGVTRIALREAILRLRTLGVLQTSRGKRSIVAKMDSSVLARLFPLMLTLEEERSFEDIFQVRLTFESDTAFMAAENRTEEDLAALDELIATMDALPLDARDEWVKQDVGLHRQIARATRNPMYEITIDALSHFITHLQLAVHDRLVKDHVLAPNRKMTASLHTSLVEAIRDEDPEYARVLMQAHLRQDARTVSSSGVLDFASDKDAAHIQSNNAAASDLLDMVLEQYSG